MGKPQVVYEIRDVDGEYVCSRGTMAECRRMLKALVTDPPRLSRWSDGPYSVRKVTTEHKFTFRPRQQPGEVQKEKKA